MMRVAFFVVGFIGFAFPALAQAPPPDGEDATRYSYSRVDDGYLRLDLRSGQVSLCARRAAGWSCQLAADERAALDAELTRLQNENVALKRALLDRNLPLPDGIRPMITTEGADKIAKAKPGDGGLKLPDSADVDRMVSVAERLWKRLVDVMADLQREMAKRN